MPDNISNSAPSKGRSLSPSQKRKCTRKSPITNEIDGRCVALVYRKNNFEQCKVCISDKFSNDSKCHHHRLNGTSKPSRHLPIVNKRKGVFKNDSEYPSYKFSLDRRGSPALAVIGNGVEIRDSKLLAHLITDSAVTIGGLYSTWVFNKGDFITLYDGEVWLGNKNQKEIKNYAPEEISHVLAGRGIINDILGLRKPLSGRGGASFANSVQGIRGATANCAIYIDSKTTKRVPYKIHKKYRSSRNRTEKMVYNNLVVLVASQTILPGDELVFNYHVTY